MRRKRDNKRIEKAIDELIKISDDGFANYWLKEVVDRLRRIRDQE